MMQLFRKYMVDIGRRDLLNQFNAFMEAKTYTELSDGHKKTNAANTLMK